MRAIALNLSEQRVDSSGTETLRFGEVDAMRGVAIIMMVIYHLMWNLLFFGLVSNVSLQTGFWKYFQRTTASTFIFLVGVSLVLSYNRLCQKRLANYAIFRRFFWRGLRIFGFGMIISGIVRLVGTGTVDFGVLHLIGFSVIAAYPFLRLAWVNIGLWALLNVVGFFSQQVTVNTKWLVWLGFEPPFYFYVDYFPVIPWFGVVLFGIGIANLLYPDNRRVFRLYAGLPPSLAQPLQYLGRHSLVIYLLHQPVLFGGLTVLLYLFAK